MLISKTITKRPKIKISAEIIPRPCSKPESTGVSSNSKVSTASLNVWNKVAMNVIKIAIVRPYFDVIPTLNKVA